jgi:hypothetical protein
MNAESEESDVDKMKGDIREMNTKIGDDDPLITQT